MKILQVMAGGVHGGAETAFIDMCIALHEAGQTIEVATRRNPRNARLVQHGITVHELAFGGVLDVITPRRMRRVMAAFQPAIVQTWMSRAAQKAPRWRPGDACPRYLSVARLGGYYARKNFANSDYFTTITPDIRRHLMDHGVPGDKVRHINNFAETEVAPAPASRAALDTPGDAVVLLGLGRLHKAKAFDMLVKAIADIPGVYAWIAGEGPMRGELEALCAQLHLEDRVRLLGWRDDRAALFQASNICVFPSRYEPFGTVFVQAWAQRTPLIVADADGPRQYVRHEQDGLVVPVDDVAALSAAIRRLMGDTALARAMAEMGHARYRGEFTRDICVQSYLAFYREILEREKLPHHSDSR